MEKEVLELENKRVRALLDRDIGTLDRMLAEEFIHTESNGTVRSKVEFLTGFQEREFEFEFFVIEENSVRIYGNTAVVAGRYHNRIRIRGELRPLKRARHLRVYVKGTSGWLLVAHQATELSEGVKN